MDSPTVSPTPSQIIRACLTELFKSEAELQRYLLTHLHLLSNAIKMQLEKGDTEVSIGSFRADLIAESDDGLTVLAELQLGRSDHRHLGQMLSYIATQLPDVFVWVAESFRPEDIAAIRFINSIEKTRVIAVTANLLRIGNSPWALDLDAVEGHLTVATSGSTEANYREELYARYWAELSTAIMQADSAVLYSHNDSRQKRKTTAWRHGLGVDFRISLTGSSSVVALDVVGTRTAPPEYSRAVYAQLLSHRDALEHAFSGDLTWRDDTCSIVTIVPGGGYRRDLDTAIPRTVEAMRSFQHAVILILEQLPWDDLERLALETLALD